MENNKKIPLVVICGPTASGKTALSLSLARYFDAEIVSADSMQIYKGMDIATAKPSESEMESVKHHMIGFVETNENYSVAEYAAKARDVIADIYGRGKIPFLVGGTGLYISSILDNIEFGKENYDNDIREALNKRLIAEGAEVLLTELSEFDQVSAQRIGTSNHRRLIRAIEIYKTTGRTMTSFIEESKLTPSPYNDVRLGITYLDRQKLYERINIRVDEMIENGLIEEAEDFLKMGYNSTGAKAIGYKELEPYFRGIITLDEAVENLKRETRRYAKRQLTWFRRDEKIVWLYRDVMSENEILKKALETVEKSLII